MGSSAISYFWVLLFYTAAASAGEGQRQAGQSAYEKCRPENSYFEPTVRRELLKWRSAPSSPDSCPRPGVQSIGLQLPELSKPFPPSCVREALSLGRGSASHHDLFNKCPSDESAPASPLAKIERPCLSRDYIEFIYESFLKASECSGVSPYELFPMLNFESGFQTNLGTFRIEWAHQARVFKYNRDWGIAQLTPPAIQFVNKSGLFDRLRESAQCSSLRPYLRKLNPNLPCERMRPPQNPILSVLYAGTFYRALKTSRDLAAILDEWNRSLSPKISEDELEKIRVTVARYMYNGGTVGVLAALETFLHEEKYRWLRSAHDPAPTADWFFSAFPEYLKRNYGLTIRYFQKMPPKKLREIRINLSSYVPAMASGLHQVEQKAGAQCGE